uniref:transposase n=1 Tax=Novosphingobium sp. ZN18A2 TaxID=3079861 RepID=UPI00403F8D07
MADDEWAIIGTLLPPERGRGCRPAQDNRLYFEGMMWIARTGGVSRMKTALHWTQGSRKASCLRP